MFQRVLWLTDLSSASRLARRPLRRLCSGAERGAVTLVHPEARELQLPDSKVQERIASLSSGLLERGIDVEVLSLSQRIKTLLQDREPQLVLVSTGQPVSLRSRDPVLREVLGSAGCPVWIAGPSPSEVIQHLVCYVDLSSPSSNTIRASYRLARWFDASCTFLGMLERPQNAPPEQQLEPIRKKVLEDLGPERLESLKHGYELGWSLDFTEGLLDVARNFDLLVLGQSKSAWWQRALMSSLPERLAQDINIPIFVTPP